jgi:hypothetical protein
MAYVISGSLFQAVEMDNCLNHLTVTRETDTTL